ncbi:MAG TPA: transposase [candidate division Zixibacteria bacterium]|nr:transposase [candidate division Zixibacteria bacterium]
MKYNPDAHHRRSIRLKGYDYARAGAYFVTICTQGRENLFGEIKDGEAELNAFGKVVKSEWLKTPDIRPNVILDEWIIMPNHVHGIIAIDNGRGTLPRAQGTQQRAPTVERFGKPVSNSIPTIVRMFKATTTKRINEMRELPYAPVWQRNYYEHVIRDEESLNKIREYIIHYLARWEYDLENAAGKPDGVERDSWKVFMQKRK